MIAILLWIINQFLLAYLLPYEGQANLNGIIFHIFYNSLDLHPILYYFGFFLVGTVLGDIIFRRYSEIDKGREEKIKFMKSLLVLGIILIILGMFISFPNFLVHDTISSQVYSLGVNFVILSLLLLIEEFEKFKRKRSYKFFFYYSYYSLGIYLTHYLLYFLFTTSLNALNVWIAIFGIGLVLTTLIRFFYKKFGYILSLKIQVGRISSGLAKILEERKNL